MEFSQGAQVIGSEAAYVRTPADAAKDAAALKGGRIVSCLTRSARPVVAEQLKRQGLSATIRSVRITRYVLPIPNVVAAFHIAVELVDSGTRLIVQQDLVFLARGRAEVRAVSVDVGIVFPQELERNIVRKLSEKLRHS